MDKSKQGTIDIFGKQMNIKRQVKEKLGHVVKIDVTLNLSLVKRVLNVTQGDNKVIRLTKHDNYSH